ncbi:hypothetical protein [Microbacterium sp. 22242]|uniref:hypothetical protein n=1 Tax=Microbacterium sp. 22242 TaxID=3453896 RepID=UPI003F8316FE
MRLGRASSRRRAAIAVLAVAACATALFLPRPALTDASYTDSEHVASGTVTAATLASPTNMTCTTTKALGILTSVTVSWQSAYPLSPTTGPTTKLVANPSSDIGPVASAGSAPPYTYTMTLDQGLLGSILQNALGSTVTFTVTNDAGTNWKSASLTKTLTTGALGGNPKCT